MPGTNPIFPAIGSTITAARSSFMLLNILRKPSISLYLHVTVCFAKSFGMPGESGRPNVETPEPAFINSESTCPW